MKMLRQILRDKPSHVAGWSCAVATMAFSAFAFPAVAAKADAARLSVQTQTPVYDITSGGTALLTRVDGLTDKLAEDFLADTAVRKAVGANLIDAASHQSREHKCLSEAIFYEARSEGKDGQKAVAEVVQNRVRSKHYPNSVCGVVYQGSERRTGCQFSFTCDGSMSLIPSGKTWTRAQEIATLALTDGITPMTERATHYHTIDVQPVWSDTLVMTKQIGTHKFYRTRWRERGVASASLMVAPPSP